MNAEVPRSITSGSGSIGKPKAIGLVPSAALAPPGGATMGGAATVWMPMRPARATIST
jgi:hypothetical protein